MMTSKRPSPALLLKNKRGGCVIDEDDDVPSSYV